MIYVSARFSVKDECIEDFRQKARIIVAENGMEDENVACDLFESIEHKNTFTIMEVWNGMEAFEMYRQTDRYREAETALKSYASHGVQSDIFKMVI